MSTPTLEREPEIKQLHTTSPVQSNVGTEVLVVRDGKALEKFTGIWEDLAASACEPNIFYEPWFFLPSLELFGADYTLEFHLVFEGGRGPGSESPLLLGFFPFERRPRYKRLPAPVLSFWRHMYCLLCTPLVRCGYEQTTIRAVMEHNRKSGGPAVMEWPYLTSNGGVVKALKRVLRQMGTASFVDETWERALLNTRHGKTGEEYIHEILGRRRRKELKRQANRMEEVGRVEYSILEPELGPDAAYLNADTETWIADFLRLEASGWKGKAGTAFLSMPAHEKFFRTIAQEAHQRQRLRMMALRLDGQSIAASCDFLSNDGAFAFKIGFDENYARYSPGVQLEVENIKRLHSRPEVSWMDSCAVREHSMINRLCNDRRPLQNLVVASNDLGTGIVRSLPRLRALKRTVRRLHQAATPRKTEENMTQTTSSTAPAPKTNLLELDAETFKRDFNRKAFTVRHNLADHPLFALPRLIELSKALPETSVEYNSGKVPVSQDPNQTPRTGLSIEETLKRIEEHNSWMVLKNVERDPEYKAILDACLDEVKPLSEPLAPGMFRREAFIFVSSAGSTTPYHIDPEYNFLLQIRGTKFMSVFDREDRTVLSEQELENYLAGAHRNLTFKDEYQAKGTVFELPPGVGLHVPVTAPHWVKNGDAVSISLSITFQTPENERRRTIYRVNAGMRKRGFHPVPYGKAAWQDAVKFNAFRVARKIGIAGR